MTAGIQEVTTMKSRSLFVLAIGFGILIVLIAALGFGALRRADTIYAEVQSAQESYLQTEAFRRGIVTDLYLADILVRDYLLDQSAESVQKHRPELLSHRDQLQQRLNDLSDLVGETDSPRLAQLQEVVEGYWESLDPIFEWTPLEKSMQGSAFLRRRVLPRRQAVVDLAREMARINEENLARARQRMQDSQRVLHNYLLQMMASTLGLGIIVALLTTRRVSVLERKHDEQTKQIEQTQNNLRRLSRRLVQAQELERQALSRELHDEVGQMMTALGMELGHLETLRHGNADAFRTRLEDAKRLNSDAMRAIRDLAPGMRKRNMCWCRSKPIRMASSYSCKTTASDSIPPPRAAAWACWECRSGCTSSTERSRSHRNRKAPPSAQSFP
jgi:signal transduction histidine kinase